MTGLVASEVTRRHRTRAGVIVALDGVSVVAAPGSRTAVVGESGSGKTTLLKMLLGLDCPDSGSVTLDDVPVAPGSMRSMRWFRRCVQYVPQDPASSLDPRRDIVALVATPLRRLGIDCDHATRARACLQSVGIDERLFAHRPTELSGGQNQRVAIARAIACEPSYLLADEPVSGLDLDLRAQVLDVLDDTVTRTSAALLTVTHDLSVATALCDEVVVMKGGRIVEKASLEGGLDGAHPYTRELRDAIPLLPPR